MSSVISHRHGQSSGSTRRTSPYRILFHPPLPNGANEGLRGNEARDGPYQPKAQCLNYDGRKAAFHTYCSRVHTPYRHSDQRIQTVKARRTARALRVTKKARNSTKDSWSAESYPSGCRQSQQQQQQYRRVDSSAYPRRAYQRYCYHRRTLQCPQTGRHECPPGHD